MAKIGYARVSTKEQNLAMQIEYLKSHGVSESLIFVDEGVSGIVDPKERKGFKKLLNKLRGDDVLVVYKLDRISRKYNQVKEIISELRKDGIGLEIGGLPNINTGNQLMDELVTDTILGLLGYIVENERELIRERQKDGIEQAKKAGKYKGKPKKYSADSKNQHGRQVYYMIVDELKNGHSKHSIQVKYNVGYGTVLRIAKELKEDDSNG